MLMMAEWYDTKSNVKLGGFRSQLEAFYLSSCTEELWYNEKSVCGWQYKCVCVCEKIDYIRYTLDK